MSEDNLARPFGGSCSFCHMGHMDKVCPFQTGGELCLDVGHPLVSVMQVASDDKSWYSTTNPESGVAMEAVDPKVKNEEYTKWLCHNRRQLGHWKADCRNPKVFKRTNA